MSMISKPSDTPIWLRRVLVIAGIYNLVWGVAVILAPGMMFKMMELPAPTYPTIWQCVGMIVGVYGIGYLVAARDPIRHWPIVLVGLLGKVFGPIGYVYAAFITAELPSKFIWVIIPNDLIWWVPFAMILWLAARHNQQNPEATEQPSLTIPDALRSYADQHGVSLGDRSDASPIMLVFLRHLGCTFCMETLQDLRDQRDQIELQGIRPVLVHMSPQDEAAVFFEKYGLEDVSRVSDPSQALYQTFELGRGSALQLFGPSVWFAGLRAFLRGNAVGKLQGDGFQMPGVFVVHRGKVIQAHRHKTAGERPGYDAIACEIPA